MTYLERFLSTMRYKPADRPVYQPVPVGFWQSTLRRWQGEGLDPSLRDYREIVSSFGFDPNDDVGIYFGMCPAFEPKVLEEDDEYVIYVNHEGIKMRELKANRELTMPEFLEFPVKDREDFKNLLPRLALNESERFPKDWKQRCGKWAARDVPLSVNADREGGFFGPLRNLMGLENLCLTYYDDPGLMEMMLENRVELMLSILGKICAETTFDWFVFWEDMCYNCAPLLSPALFKQYMSPAYRKVCDFLYSKGVDVIFVDSDGKIDELIPLWLEAGVNGIYPMEVQSGADVVRYRAEYGRDLRIIGGIDKKALLRGKRDILSEITRVMPVVEQGGYIPGIDHSIPPDISYENFLYYLNELKSAFGM